MTAPHDAPGWSRLTGIPMPTQMVCHPDDEARMRAALDADPIWAKVELIANSVVGRGVLLLVDQRATAVYGEPVPPDYEHAVTQQRFCCDTVRGSEHLRHCPFAYRPIEPVGPVRYGQCDATCTTDCGHCKGQGPPAAPSAQSGVQLLPAFELSDAQRQYQADCAHRWSAWAVGYRRQCLVCRAWSEQDEPRNDTPAQPVRDTGEG